jgi:hypothetical protein
MCGLGPKRNIKGVMRGLILFSTYNMASLLYPGNNGKQNNGEYNDK